MCPVIHIMMLVFINNTFHFELVGAGLTVRTMHSFPCPDSQTTIKFALQDLHEDILNTSVLCCFRQMMESVTVNSIKTCSATAISYRMMRLG